MSERATGDAAVLEAEAVAEEAGLRYVSDATPGIRRRRHGSGFGYRRPDGEAVDARTRTRIQELAVPPAWTDVWICPSPNGHLQATGRDARGRKQYRYHDRWREVRDADKFSKLLDFGEALPALRDEVERDLVRRGSPRDQVVALVVRLLDETLIRVGNEEYAAENESYGLTTLRRNHVDLERREFTLCFMGKSGVEHEVTVEDPKLARIVRRCHELGGQELFSYRNGDGEIANITSADVNDYLHRLIGPDGSAKVFRTWGATTVVARSLADLEPPDATTDADAAVLAAIDEAAGILRNSRAVCRQSYVHPAVLDAFRDGSLREAWQQSRGRGRLDRSDRTVLRVLRDQADQPGAARQAS